MVEQKIVRFVYKLPSDYNKVIKMLEEGWVIKFSPAIIPAFAGYAPEILFVLERELI